MLDRAAALDMLSDIDEVYTSRGRKQLYFDLRDTATDREEVADAITGPTGNLRAPSLRHGRTLLVGFNEENLNRFLPN